MKRVGRPPSAYKTRHVMINMRDEWYQYMRKNNMNMSEEINKYLDARFNLKICPTCFMDVLVHRQCDNCLGDAIFCDNKECTDYATRVGNSCPTVMYFGKMQPTCTSAQFYGK